MSVVTFQEGSWFGKARPCEGFPRRTVIWDRLTPARSVDSSYSIQEKV